MEYRMVFFPFDATSLDVEAPAQMQSFVTGSLTPFLQELAQRHNVKGWKVISHSVSVEGNKGLLSIFVESLTT
jgi:hypothetical protein